MTIGTPLQARPGRVLSNRFQLTRPLGQGGMGEVWLAHDRDLGVDIAIKLLHPALASAPAQVEFLKNECRLARRLTHPHIVPVYDFHHDREAVFISMAWVDGNSFDHWIRQVKRPWDQRLRPLVSIAHALHYVHQQGLVHRDVKAGNILMDETDRPHLTDFGIAGVYRIDADRSRRHSGGSQDCMSPQQRQGLAPHPADDTYSFGILLLETLVPGLPFENRLSGAEDVQAALGAAPPTTPELTAMIVSMLAERREDRPSTMGAVASAIEPLLADQARRTMPPQAAASTPDDTAERPAAPVITPRPFAAPDIRNNTEKPARSWQLPVFLSIAALLLVGGGGGLLHYLARNPLVTAPTAVSQPATPSASKPSQAPVPPPQPSTGDASRAEDALADWRQALSNLEAIGGPQWAPEAFAAIAGEAKTADEAFLQSDYTTATRHYATAAEEARRLEATAPDVLAKLLAEAQSALAQGDGLRSRDAFTLALKIEPQNPEARKGLERAQKVAEVVALMQTGQTHETAGNLALALADYEAALALDPEWVPAQTAVPRIKNQVAEAQFDLHMSAGLAAFHRKAYAEARREIDKALAFKPGAPEALDAIRQVDNAVRNDRIARLRQQAQNAEKSEAWPQALDHYRQVLGIDSTIQFAIRGAARAEERLRLEKRATYYMDHPDALSSDAYFDKAEQLLTDLRRVAPQGPRLQSQIATLDRMVQKARTTVAVTVTSDELTEVTIYRIGRLGQFLSRTVELRPGIYTITGSRDGYQDVRHTLRIRPGQGPIQVAVQCTKKI